MKKAELNKVLDDHDNYLKGRGGVKADLNDANLHGADLRGADLRDANLRRADLSGADLRSADIRGADLRGANLNDAGLVYFNFNGHTAYFQFDGMMRIGCEHHTLDYWLVNASVIGKRHAYSEIEIEAYQNFINMCVALQAETGGE